MPSLANLLTLVSIMVASAPLVRGRLTMGQVCNQAPNAHCIYTPPAEGLFKRHAPAVHVDRGSLLSQEPDAVGPITYLFDDETSGTLVLNCAVDKGVGVNNFSFLFNRDMSSITHEGNSTGSATIGFNDDAGEHAAIGVSIVSYTGGVDATVHCPFDS